MRNTNKMQKKATNAIIRYLSINQSASRTELIEGALSTYGLSKSELENFSPKSKSSVLRSYLSTALNSLISKHDIKREGERYMLAKEEVVIVREDECEEEILKMLECNAYTKEDIFERLEAHFGTDRTLSLKDDYSLRTIAGGVLASLVTSDTLEIIGSKYTRKREKCTKLDTPLPENEFKPIFFKQLFLMGGRFLESFVANLLEKYYTLKGQMVVYCDITGGSDDGGIDVVLETVDYLGFVEKFAVQTKCRDRAHVTEKEVREFYGAMNASGATRGIYVTTTYFHESAEDFLDSVSDLVGIDARKLFELVKKTGYGIKMSAGGYTFDTTIFAG
ncbi:MAG: restriction endonuclease [Clostridia bacterium]|nr:restriction endonuclease [Clostridia bacterium]